MRTTLTLLLICSWFSTGDGHVFSWRQSQKIFESWSHHGCLPTFRRFDSNLSSFSHTRTMIGPNSRCNLQTKMTREKLISEKELAVRMIHRSRNCGFGFIWKNLPRHWNTLNRQDVLDVWFSSFSFKFPRTLGEFDHNSPSQISEKSAILREVLFNQSILWMVSHQMNSTKIQETSRSKCKDTPGLLEGYWPSQTRQRKNRGILKWKLKK